MRFYVGAFLCLMSLSAAAGASAVAAEHTIALQTIENGALTTKCEISTVESDKYVLQVRVNQNFEEWNIGGHVALLSDDEGLLKLIERASGATFEESKSASRFFQILYSVFSEGADGKLVETPIQGYGQRNIESSFPQKKPLIDLIDHLCSTDAKVQLTP